MAKKSKLPVAMPTKTTKPIPVKIVSDVVSNKPSTDKAYEAREKKWRAEDDMRVMKQAEEIKADKSRMKAMKEVAKEQMNTLKKFC